MNKTLPPPVIRFCREQTGGISIFLSIIMIAVIILTGLLVDISRVTSAKNQTARALDIAACSVLAGFESDLQHEYGIFALKMPDPDPSVLTEYIEKNLGVDEEGAMLLRELINSGEGRPVKLYDYQIEHVALDTSMPLSDADVFERQILEFMKYRAPAALATGVMDFIQQAATAAKMADVTKIKIEIDKKLAQIGGQQENLRDYLNGDVGTTSVGDKYVKNFNKNADRDALAERIADLYYNYADLSLSIYEAKQERKRSGTPDPEADKAERMELSEYKNDLQMAVADLVENQTSAFLDANRKAIGCVDKISLISEEIKMLYKELDKSIEKFDEEDLETQFTETFLEEAERGKESLIDIASGTEKVAALNKNLETLSRAVNAMNEISRKMLGYSPPAAPASMSDIMKKLKPDISSYDYGITYEYKKAVPIGAFADPREFVDDRIAELLETNDREKPKEKKLSDIGVYVPGLPSRSVKMWWETLFSPGEAALKPEEFVAAGAAPESGVASDETADIARTIKYRGVLEDGNIGYMPFDADNSFAKESLDEVSSVGDVLSDAGEGLRNAYYVGEYALSMFNNSVRDRYRWAMVTPPSKSAFFDAEVEYILHGNEKQSSNIFWTKVQLLMTRFAMNFIHIHSDTEKLEFARTVATALVSWFSSGTLVPLVTDLILMAWSIKEAIEDVHDLLNGKKIAFIKLPGDWKTNIGVSTEGKPKTREEFKWSYIDHLRIYLLTVPRLVKLARICDLIEINTKYAGRELKIKDFYCEVDCELTTSVNYLFMTAWFMPRWIKTPEDRHILDAAASRNLF